MLKRAQIMHVTASPVLTRLKSAVQKRLPQVGLEPTTFGLEVQRAIHCATGACYLR